MNYGVEITLYNPDLEAIERIEKYKKVFRYILVVDNSDNDNEFHYKLSNDNDIEYVGWNENKGISKALEMAFLWAKNRGLDYLLTMDQDSDYSVSNIKKMIDYIDDVNRQDVGIFVANFAKLYWDEKKSEWVAGKYVIPIDEIREVKFCLTSSSFVNVKAIEQILPLPDFFVSYVDNSISTELIKRGYTLLRVGKSCFLQQVGGVVQNTWYNQTFRVLHHSDLRYFYMVRNNCLYRKLYGEDRAVYLESYKRLIRYFFNIIFGEKKKISKIKACYWGYREYKKDHWGKIPDEIMNKLRKYK